MRPRSEDEIAKRNAYINGYRPFVKYNPDATYQGCYHNSRMEGYGVITYSKLKLVYDGQWKDSKAQGQGTLRRLMDDGTSKRIYIGQWVKGKRCGEGKMFHKDGIYYGFWRDNQRSGIGIMWFKDGRLYLGEWDSGLFHGNGILIYPNGNRYEGSFEYGLKHGEGLYVHIETGQVQKGVWCHDFCKASMMFDEFRNQVIRPTPYPIEKIKLANPSDVVKMLFREHLPDPILKLASNVTCLDHIIKMRRKLLSL